MRAGVPCWHPQTEEHGVPGRVQGLDTPLLCVVIHCVCKLLCASLYSKSLSLTQACQGSIRQCFPSCLHFRHHSDLLGGKVAFLSQGSYKA